MYDEILSRVRRSLYAGSVPRIQRKRTIYAETFRVNIFYAETFRINISQSIYGKIFARKPAKSPHTRLFILPCNAISARQSALQFLLHHFGILRRKLL